MPAWNRLAHGSLPWRWCASAITRTVPGTPTGRPSRATSLSGRVAPSMSVRRLAVVRAGAAARPSSADRVPLAWSHTSISVPPPNPDDCGSTTVSTICTAMAASTTLPPRLSASSAAGAANGLAAATMPGEGEDCACATVAAHSAKAARIRAVLRTGVGMGRSGKGRRAIIRPSWRPVHSSPWGAQSRRAMASIQKRVEGSCGAACWAGASSSRMMFLASALPNSTPHWSNGLMPQITPCVNTLCS